MGSTTADRLARARAGDKLALRELLSALGPHVLRTTRRILGSGADAEDAAQDAMTDLVRALGSVREASALVPFAVRLSVRVAIRVRARKRREHARRSAPTHAEPWNGDQAEEASARFGAERVLSALTQLPDAQAEALVLRYVAGLEPAEIAASMGVSVNTVRSRVRLAREALARRLGHKERR